MSHKVNIDSDRCKGCALCIQACPKKLLRISKEINGKGFHPAEGNEKIIECIGCGQCFIVCPDNAIEIIEE